MMPELLKIYPYYTGRLAESVPFFTDFIPAKAEIRRIIIGPDSRFCRNDMTGYFL